MTEHTPDASATCRLDVWLDVACVFRTRSAAQQACKGGKVVVNGQRAKPHRTVRIGDRLEVTVGAGRRRHLVVAGLAETHVPKAEARTLYEDMTPPPSAEEQQFRDLLRRAGSEPRGRVPAPTRRERRLKRRMKGHT